MKFMRSALLGSAMLMGFATMAHAADPYLPQAETPQDYANMGFYLRGDLGWSFLRWSGGDDDSAFAVGGGVGYKFGDYLRTDLRVDWAGDYSIGGGADLGISSVLGNVYLDFDNSSLITPYVGAGIGYGWTSVSPGSDDSGVAYALMAGASVDLSQSLELDVGYRFRDVSVSGKDPYEHQILTGLRFKF
jgi:opacity protein-like surface antigen